MKKIGLISLALVLAVGALGIGYAAWTDTVTIEGTVNTGDVNIDIWGISHTDVYKDLTGDDCMVVYTATDLADDVVFYHAIGTCANPSTTYVPGPPTIPTDWDLIASAHVTNVDEATNTVTVVYNNLFPSICFATDVLFHYNGSIPVKVEYDTFTTDDDWLQALVDSGDIDSTAVRAFIDPTSGLPTTGDIVDIGTQLHKCDCVLLVMGVHIPQDNALMGLTGSATYTIGVIQWNEYP